MKVNILREIPWFGGNYFHPLYFDESGFRMEGCLRAGKSVPPHYHKDFDEYWTVKQGSPIFVVGKEEHRRQPGEQFSSPRNIVHSIVNDGTEDVILITEIRPCCDMVKMMSIIAGLQDDGEKYWMFKYFYIEKKAGLREFSTLSSPSMRIVAKTVMGMVMVIGKVSGWDKFLNKYI